MQLNKYLATAGVCSRRKAVALIEGKKVTVNGSVIVNPAHQVSETDKVRVNNILVKVQEYHYVILNKPRGYVTTLSDEKNRNTVMDIIGDYPVRLYPVGRLDINTTGLLLLTNDGNVAQRVAHPRFQLKKVYHVTLHKAFSEKDREACLKGVSLSDGRVVVDRISHPLGPKKNQIRITIHSGKYRVLRRLFNALGYEVKRLDRIQYGPLSKKGLPLGMWRTMTKTEITHLKKVVGL